MPSIEDQAAAALHIGGLLVAVAWGAHLVRLAGRTRCTLPQRRVVGAFVAAWLLLYSASIAYHLAPPGSTRQVLNAFDHGAIFLLTAAGWAPLGPFKLPAGPAHRMLVLLWSTAAIGLAIEFAAVLAGQGSWFQKAAVPLYVAQALAPIVLYGRQILVGLSKASLCFLFGSMATYGGGIALYMHPEVPWNHVVWHGAIVLGCLLNFGGVRQLILERRE